MAETLEIYLIEVTQSQYFSVDSVVCQQSGISYTNRKPGIFLRDSSLYPEISVRNQAHLQHLVE